uniref:DUF547 domain-containing protein n=1 Tax=Macrostomum lignano TaxID=282301 RepID=A0A1I8F540_9PLAT
RRSETTGTLAQTPPHIIFIASKFRRRLVHYPGLARDQPVGLCAVIRFGNLQGEPRAVPFETASTAHVLALAPPACRSFEHFRFRCYFRFRSIDLVLVLSSQRFRSGVVKRYSSNSRTPANIWRPRRLRVALAILRTCLDLACVGAVSLPAVRDLLPHAKDRMPEGRLICRSQRSSSFRGTDRQPYHRSSSTAAPSSAGPLPPAALLADLDQLVEFFWQRANPSHPGHKLWWRCLVSPTLQRLDPAACRSTCSLPFLLPPSKPLNLEEALLEIGACGARFRVAMANNNGRRLKQRTLLSFPRGSDGGGLGGRRSASVAAFSPTHWSLSNEPTGRRQSRPAVFQALCRSAAKNSTPASNLQCNLQFYNFLEACGNTLALWPTFSEDLQQSVEQKATEILCRVVNDCESWTGQPRDPHQAVVSLAKELNRLFKLLASSRQRELQAALVEPHQLAEVAASKAFLEWRSSLGELKFVDLTFLKSANDKFAFFLNLRNLIAVHFAVEISHLWTDPVLAACPLLACKSHSVNSRTGLAVLGQ